MTRTSARSVILARHPAILGGDGRCYGRTDMALAPGWEAWSAGLAAVLERQGARTLHVSPQSRCLLPGRAALGDGMTLAIDARLMELDFGHWEGRSWDDAPRAALDAWAADPEGWRLPGGERAIDLRARVTAFWRDAATANEPFGVLTHGGPLRILHAHLSARGPSILPPSPPLGDIAILPLE